MSDLLRFEIWQVLLVENLCDVCLWKHRCLKIGAGLKNCSWGEVVTEAWILLWCIVCLRFTNDINSIFFPLKFSVFPFSNRRVMGSHILHWSIGLGGYKCAAADIYVIPCYERFVKIWNLASFLTRKSLWCLFMKASIRSNWPGLRNCSWGQVVTEVWILLWCIVSLRFTNDINSIFFPSNFQFFYFQIDEQWGLISCTHQSVWRAKNALHLRYTWFPAMSDLWRFEIWQVFLLENLCDVCLWKHRCVQIGLG